MEAPAGSSVRLVIKVNWKSASYGIVKRFVIGWANENPSISYKTRLRLNMIYLFWKKPQAIDSAAEFRIYELMLIFSVRRGHKFVERIF